MYSHQTSTSLAFIGGVVAYFQKWMKHLKKTLIKSGLIIGKKDFGSSSNDTIQK